MQLERKIKLFICLGLILLGNLSLVAQNENVKDTVSIALGDSVASTDTASNVSDSLKIKDKSVVSKDAVDRIIEYKSKDSIRFDINSKNMYLYEDADLKYGETSLKAAYVEINFKKNQLFAKGMLDSVDKPYGTPVFTDKEQSFKSKEMIYNFKSKKGLIKEVVTQDGESYLHGKIVKKLPNDVTYIKHGKYTTCNHDHPHYEFRFNKAKVLPKDKIVTGPIVFVVEDVPLPVGLPFGIFPNKQGRQSGVLIPSYGESQRDGFFLQDGGYYWGISDYIDLTFKGYVSTRGSWKTNMISNYKKRYKYNGNLNLDYALTKEGEKGLDDYSETRTYFIRWQHKQDPKARPNSTFNANVNAGSSKHHTLRPTNLEQYHNNTLESSISYQTNWGQNKYNLTTALRHKQNTSTHEVNLSLPEISFSRAKLYPFRGKNSVTSSTSILDNISVGYNLSATNKINAIDSVLFEKETLEKFSYGLKHSIPITSTVKLLKYFNLNNTLTLNELFYPSRINRSWNNGMQIEDSNNDGVPDTSYGFLETDTIQRFSTAVDFAYQSTLSTKLYGMFMMKRGPVRALRHVMTPSVGFSYAPDFADPRWGYYKYYLPENYDPNHPIDPVAYSIYANGIYGSPKQGKTGTINFGLANNFEMKVKSNKDTTGVRKVKLIDNLSFTGNYDLTKDSMNLSNINMNAYTKLFKNLDVRFTGSFDPYVAIIDSTGTKRRINRLEWVENHRPFRLESTDWQFGLNYKLSSKTFLKSKNKKDDEKSDVDTSKKSDSEIDWDMNFNYTFKTHTNRDLKGFENYNSIVQNLSFSGSISPTPMWSLSYNSAYDFESRKLSYINVNIGRDLHCWEILFTWVPLGYGGNTSYHFTIRLKAQLLQDLKYEIKKQPWDN